MLSGGANLLSSVASPVSVQWPAHLSAASQLREHERENRLIMGGKLAAARINRQAPKYRGLRRELSVMWLVSAYRGSGINVHQYVAAAASMSIYFAGGVA